MEILKTDSLDVAVTTLFGDGLLLCSHTAYHRWMGIAISTNGLDKTANVINVTNSKIAGGAAAGLYLPGGAQVKISGDKTEISGYSGIDIKSGSLTITDKVKITATGAKAVARNPVSVNGSDDTGAGIAVFDQELPYGGAAVISIGDEVPMTTANDNAAPLIWEFEAATNTGGYATITWNAKHVALSGTERAASYQGLAGVYEFKTYNPDSPGYIA